MSKGKRIRPIKELPLKIGRSRLSNISRLFAFRKSSTASDCSKGNSPTKIFDPSKGLIGIRLKKANPKLIIKNRWINSKVIIGSWMGTILRRIPTRTAQMMLLKGPERAINPWSLLGWRKLYGSIGTGLPQPKPRRKRATVPIGSKWANGFKVNLPSSFGVGSPR